jgi:hypothetical protein
VAPSVAPNPSCALARPPDSVTSLNGEVTRAMVMNPGRHREIGKRQRWSELIHTLHAVLLASVCFVGGCVAMVTGHVGSGEAGVIIGGVLAVLCLVGWMRRTL